MKRGLALHPGRFGVCNFSQNASGGFVLQGLPTFVRVGEALVNLSVYPVPAFSSLCIPHLPMFALPQSEGIFCSASQMATQSANDSADHSVHRVAAIFVYCGACGDNSPYFCVSTLGCNGERLWVKHG